MEKNDQLKKASTPLVIEQGKEIDRAFRKAVREALLRHKREGNPIAVWQDEKVVILQPDEIDPG